MFRIWSELMSVQIKNKNDVSSNCVVCKRIETENHKKHLLSQTTSSASHAWPPTRSMEQLNFVKSSLSKINCQKRMLNVERWMEQNLRKTYKGRFDSNSSPSSERQLCDKKQYRCQQITRVQRGANFLFTGQSPPSTCVTKKKQLSKTKFAKQSFCKQLTPCTSLRVSDTTRQKQQKKVRWNFLKAT